MHLIQYASKVGKKPWVSSERDANAALFEVAFQLGMCDAFEVRPYRNSRQVMALWTRDGKFVAIAKPIRASINA